MEQLRGNTICDVHEVAYAVVETSGNLSDCQKFTAQTVTADMMQIPTPGGADAPPQVIISDGIIIPEALQFCNLRRQWLDKKLADEDIVPKDIFLMTCNRNAEYHIVLREEQRRKSKGKTGPSPAAN